jgi:hypothetical protein
VYVTLSDALLTHFEDCCVDGWKSELVPPLPGMDGIVALGFGWRWQDGDRSIAAFRRAKNVWFSSFTATSIYGINAACISLPDTMGR